jgi:hypothetical protein
MRTDSPEVPPQRPAATNQVRIAISGALRQLYDYDQAQPLPDHLAQLLERLDVGSAGSQDAGRDQTTDGNRGGV